MTEIFKTIEINGAEYSVGNFGSVYGKNGKIKTRLDKDGYTIFTAGKKGYRTSVAVHKLVAKLFIDNPFGYNEVNHKDYNRANPRFDNLEWCTHKYNVQYSACNSNSRIGSRNNNSQLTEFDVKNIKKRIANGDSVALIARDYGRGWQTINHIKQNNTWKHV